MRTVVRSGVLRLPQKSLACQVISDSPAATPVTGSRHVPSG
ncbi:MAG: hypothetical protein ACK595_07335 [Planctomycetota bacterium]